VSSAILYLAIVAIWACVLVPRWLRRPHEQSSDQETVFETYDSGEAEIADTGEPGTYMWAEFVLGQPGLRLGGGTDEIQKNIVAERVLGLPR